MTLIKKLTISLALVTAAVATVPASAIDPYSFGQDYPSVTVYTENNGMLRGLEMRTIWTAGLNDIIRQNLRTKEPEIVDISVNAYQKHISEYYTHSYAALINCATPIDSFVYERSNQSNNVRIKNAMSLDTNHPFYIDRKAVEGIFSAYC